jgi:outer membrane lipoprotein-sorting protein
MNRSVWLGFVLAVSGLAQPPQPDSVIARILEPFRSFRPCRGEFVITYQPNRPTLPAETHHRTIRFAGPKRYVTEEQEPFPWINYVTDGVRWSFAPDILKYTKMPWTPSIDPVEYNSLARLAGMALRNPRFLGDCNCVIQADSQRGTETFYLDDRQQLRKVVTEGETVTVTLTILALDLNPTFSDEEFRFVPPPGSVQVSTIARSLIDVKR